jgi:hypothetical protein
VTCSRVKFIFTCIYFNIINLIDFVTFLNIRRESLKMMSIHRNMSEYFSLMTLFLILRIFVGLNNELYQIHGTYIEIGICGVCVCVYSPNLNSVNPYPANVENMVSF